MLKGREGKGHRPGVDLGCGEGDQLDVFDLLHNVAGQAGQGVMGQLDGELLVFGQVPGDEDVIDLGIYGGLRPVVAR